MTDIKYFPLEDFPGYMACSDGYLINIDNGYVLKGSTKKTGYKEVILRDQQGEPRYILVHRLIAACFCDKSPDADEVNHIDGDKSNNRADNLEWTTRGGNLKHAYETGLRSDDVSPRGVIAKNIFTGEQLLFTSIYQASKALGISKGNICLCCQGRRPYASGYTWEYIKVEEE